LYYFYSWLLILSQHSESGKPASGTTSISEKINHQLDNLMIDFREHTRLPEVDYDNALKFWAQQRHVYPELADLAEDLIACPASQAYVERVFSICGMLSAGRRNRMTKSMQMRASLKLNNTVLAVSGFTF
jgi:hAT family C-terminal dimerisation region